MKNIYSIVAATLFTLGAISSLSSCEKDETTPPELFFKTTQGYTSSNTLVPRQTEVKIGINAVNASDKDFLTKFTITRSKNSGAASIVVSKNLTGVDRDAFGYDYIITTEDVASVDEYTFTVESDDGLKSKISLTLDVQ